MASNRTSQNRSTAVMQRCHEAPDSLNYFPTPPWATRALCEWLETRTARIPYSSVWEPACGEGHMARPLAEFFQFVTASDVHDYSATFRGQHRVGDFLVTWDHSPMIQAQGVDWIITNPPFRLAQEFIATALGIARQGVAMLVRSAFLESRERYEALFAKHPPTDILQFVERVPMHKGKLSAEATTATAYCWLVWHPSGHGGLRQDGAPRFRWIAPCRARLERPSDYPAAELAPAPLFDEAM